MASDMSGFQGPDGAQRWMAASGGDMAAYNREMQAWQRAQSGTDTSSIRNAAAGQSEDFARFNDATVQGWTDQYYDAAASKAAGRPQYRSMRGAPGFYDKPTECPDGQGPSGPNETDPCTSTGYSTPNPWEQGGGGAQGAGAAGGGKPGDPNYYDPDNPLQAKLMELMQSGGGSMAGIDHGSFTKGGGAMWSTPTAPLAAPGGAPVAPSAAAPVPAAPGAGQAALVSATLNAFTPNAPSAQFTPGNTSVGFSTGTPKTQAPAPAAVPAAPVPAAVAQLTAPGGINKPMDMRDPNAWWRAKSI